MAFGPGKYDDVCTDVMVKNHAEGVLVIVFGGNRGHGFSCQATPQLTATLPDILRKIAGDMERDLRGMGMGKTDAV